MSSRTCLKRRIRETILTNTSGTQHYYLSNLVYSVQGLEFVGIDEYGNMVESTSYLLGMILNLFLRSTEVDSPEDVDEEANIR